jgi:C1A family cysteine protease
MAASVARTGKVPAPNKKNERILGGHALSLVGYDDEAQVYHVANSWGSNWGTDGFCTIPYEYVHDKDDTGDFWTARQFL